MKWLEATVVASYLQHNRSSNYSQVFLSMNLVGLELIEEFSTEMEISYLLGLFFSCFSHLFGLLVTGSIFAFSLQ